MLQGGSVCLGTKWRRGDTLGEANGGRRPFEAQGRPLEAQGK
jgi:hypothetical protein